MTKAEKNQLKANEKAKEQAQCIENLLKLLTHYRTQKHTSEILHIQKSTLNEVLKGIRMYPKEKIQNLNEIVKQLNL